MDDTDNMPEVLHVTLVDYSYCIGTTIKGNQCRKKPGKNNYCSTHSHMFIYNKPDDCPICMDDIANESQPLSCGHWVHKQCILKWKPQCPVCRSDIKLTKKELAVMNSNDTECDEEAVYMEGSNSLLSVTVIAEAIDNIFEMLMETGINGVFDSGIIEYTISY